jgi:MFS family permease
MKLNYKNTILVGLAFLTISAFWQLYDFIIPLILQNRFGINHTTSGFIMSVDNILALFMLPLFGRLSDKTYTKIGRRTPFIIIGTLAAVIFMIGIPYATHTRQLVVFMLALGLVLISMAIYRSPAVALMPDVTPKPLRSLGNAVINLMGSIGGASILLINAFLAPDTTLETANYWPLFITMAVIMLVGTAVLVSTVREPKLVKKMREDSAAMGIDTEEAKEEKPVAKNEKLPPDMRKSMGLILASIFLWFMGYNAVTTSFSKYAVNALGMQSSQASLILMVATVAAALSFIPVGHISMRIGRRKSILFGVVLLAAVFGTASFYTAFSPLMFVSFALAGVAWASINVNSLPMVLEMSKGASVGQYTGYYYTFSMAAQVVTPVLSGVLLDNIGYSTLLPYGAIFVGLAFFTMLFVRHGDSKPMMPKNKLESFDTPD